MSQARETDLMRTTKSFDSRKKLALQMEKELVLFFERHNFLVTPYGFEKTISIDIQNLLKDEKYKNKSDIAMMVRYAPDYLAVNPEIDPTKGTFLLEFKVNLTPIYSDNYIKRIRKGDLSITRFDIGEIEREAFEVYTRYYPPKSVCLVIGCVYHPRTLIADWTTNLDKIYEFKKARNILSEGSGTPHVNIHLGKMRALIDFLEEEVGIEVNKRIYSEIIKKIRTLPLLKPSWISQTVYERVYKELQVKCPWLRRIL